MDTKSTHEELQQHTPDSVNGSAAKPVAQELLEHEPNFKTFTEKSPNMIFINRGGSVVYANKKCTEIMGYTREEFYSEDFDFSSLIAPESLELVKTNFRSHMRGEELEPYEYALITKDGKKVQAIITSKLITYEGERAIIGIVTDITARKRAEEALRKSEAKFRLAFENAPIGMALCDMDGSYFQANPAYCDMLDYSQLELQELNFKDFIHPEDLEKQMRCYEQCQKGAIDSYQIDSRYFRKDGEIIWANITVAITQDEEQKPLYALIMAKDITVVKMAEENRHRLEAQLRQAQKLEAIGTLAGGIAHDFNNILGAIIGYSEMSIFDTKKKSMLHHNLQQVLKASHRARDLVKQILAFSRTSDLDKKIIQLTPIMKEVLKLLRASMPTTIEIRLNIESELGPLYADPSQIHQVMMNLCTNSAHAMESTGGVLEINLANVDLGTPDLAQFPDLSPGRYVKLIVRDTGHGMDQSTLERLFDPYFSTKSKDKGTGLGLAVVHGIIKGHDGGIHVISKPGKGTTVEILLPETAGEISLEPSQSAVPPPGKEQILFVDDEDALIELANDMLTRLGYRVVTKTNPIEALETFRKNPDQYDLVITDMTMPNMTGDMLAKELMKIRPNIPIVLCTGFSHKINHQRATAIGIKGFLMKPLTYLILAKAVREALEKQ
jgi:PAS domain S-box-containing protein